MLTQEKISKLKTHTHTHTHTLTCCHDVTWSGVLTQEKISKLKTSETKLEEDKKNLRTALDEAETRCTKVELARRSVDGELQRLKLAMTDKDTENQVRGVCCGGLRQHLPADQNQVRVVSSVGVLLVHMSIYLQMKTR